MIYFINIIGVSAIALIDIYIWTKLFKVLPNWKKITTYFFIIGFILIMFFNYYYVNQFLKIISITLIMMIFCKLFFKVSINKSIVGPLVSQFIIMISELIFSLVVLFFIGPDVEQIVNNYFGSLFTNFSISILAFILIRVKLGYRLYDFLIKITSKIKKYELIVFSIILVISVNLIEMSIYYKISIIWLILINTSLIVIYAILIFQMANTKNEYLTISEKYNRSKNSLTEYQSVVSRYRIDNHENKSQLKRLRNKIDKENKEAIEYIDMILDTRIKNNEKILNKTKIIPDSDLKVLIDSKIMTMEEKNIKNRLHVDKEVKTIDLIEMDPLLMEDICKIVGVYLDNAIEAVETLDKKEIQLDLYKLDDFLCISVVNNYEGEIELDKLYDVGYTTKDNGHGYGLPLVAEIVDNNKNLSKETHVNEEIFRQVLKIKM